MPCRSFWRRWDDLADCEWSADSAIRSLSRTAWTEIDFGPAAARALLASLGDDHESNGASEASKCSQTLNAWHAREHSMWARFRSRAKFRTRKSCDFKAVVGAVAGSRLDRARAPALAGRGFS